MSQIRKKYTKEEKLEIIKLSLNKDQSIKELGERFEVSAGYILNGNYTYLSTKDQSVTGHFFGASLGGSVSPVSYTSSAPGGYTMEPFYINAVLNNALRTREDSINYAERHYYSSPIFSSFLKSI